MPCTVKGHRELPVALGKCTSVTRFQISGLSWCSCNPLRKCELLIPVVLGSAPWLMWRNNVNDQPWSTSARMSFQGALSDQQPVHLTRALDLVVKNLVNTSLIQWSFYSATMIHGALDCVLGGKERCFSKELETDTYLNGEQQTVG